MSKSVLLVLSMIAVLLGNVAGAQTAADYASYRLSQGDQLNIKVFQEDDLSLVTTIGPAGTIDYPLIGEIKLSGMTLDEAEALLDGKLRGDYLVNPQISISISKYRNFFILGAVKQPGSYEYVPGMTAMQAVIIAGGFTDRAARKKVYITREDDPASEPSKEPINTMINAGDTIVVKESFF